MQAPAHPPVHAADEVGLGDLPTGLRVASMLLQTLQVLLLDLQSIKCWAGAGGRLI